MLLRLINRLLKVLSLKITFLEKGETIYSRLYDKFQPFTMVRKTAFFTNLEISKTIQDIQGDIVECGVWKGGMIASLAQLHGNDRNYWLFDSFEGLPQAKDIDGVKAKKWQSDVDSEYYYDNCTADIKDAEMAMTLADCKNYHLVKGWFNKGLFDKKSPNEIALLRLDGDWYDSTMICLKSLFPKVVKNGIVIIDDYYSWEGCSKAVHDYLSKCKSTFTIHSRKGVAYIIKK